MLLKLRVGLISVFHTLVTGVLVGYQLTQAFLATNIARAKAEQAQAITKAKELEVLGSESTM